LDSKGIAHEVGLKELMKFASCKGSESGGMGEKYLEKLE
jgi:hypothetical protein